jgi:imidazolonepropionase-like amidohydrolase
MGRVPGVIMLAVRAARLFDGVNSVLVEQPLVLIGQGRVVGLQVGGAPPAEVEVVDLGAVTLLPGLIDAHLHLAFDASDDPVGYLAHAGDGEVLDGMRTAAVKCLAAGITTVRDLGDRGYLALRLREELAARPASGPQVLAAGPPITTRRGHCWFLGGEADGVDGVRAAVRDRAEKGVDVIKVMASGGQMTPGTQSYRAQYGLDELRAAVEEAHRHGLPITAHAHATAAIANAVAAGFDMIEHCSFVTADGVDAPQELIDSIAGAGVIVTQTVGLMPGGTLRMALAGSPAHFIDAVQRLRKAGVPIVCATDGGIAASKPHDVLPYGVAALVNAAGFPPVEALRAVTSVAAQACRLGERKGRIAPGFDADLLAVQGNPLTDIAAMRAVTAVFRAGQRVQ